MNFEKIVRPDLVSGIFKFSGAISPERLIEVANRWLQENPDRVLSLGVRGCGRNNQHGIEFVARLNGPGEHHFKRFLHGATHKLKKEFGKDLVGRDISSPVWILK